MESSHGAGAGAAVVKDRPSHGDPLESQVAESEASAASAAEPSADEPAAQPIVNDRPGISDRPGVNEASAPTDEAIARRAFELYCARGRVDGYDRDDWHQAERELRATVVIAHVSSPESPID